MKQGRVDVIMHQYINLEQNPNNSNAFVTINVFQN